MDEKVIFRTDTHALYSDSEMRKLDRVIRAFYNYLRDSGRLELLWSDKVGYLLIPVDVERREAARPPRVIRTALELVEALLGEVALELAARSGKRRLSRKDYPEYQRRIEEYMAQLPEYRLCVPAAFSGG